jgi:hypothetical protein
MGSKSRLHPKLLERTRPSGGNLRLARELRSPRTHPTHGKQSPPPPRARVPSGPPDTRGDNLRLGREPRSPRTHPTLGGQSLPRPRAQVSFREKGERTDGPALSPAPLGTEHTVLTPVYEGMGALTGHGLGHIRHDAATMPTSIPLPNHDFAKVVIYLPPIPCSTRTRRTNRSKHVAPVHRKATIRQPYRPSAT